MNIYVRYAPNCIALTTLEQAKKRNYLMMLRSRWSNMAETDRPDRHVAPDSSNTRAAKHLASYLRNMRSKLSSVICHALGSACGPKLLSFQPSSRAIPGGEPKHNHTHTYTHTSFVISSYETQMPHNIWGTRLIHPAVQQLQLCHAHRLAACWPTNQQYENLHGVTK